MFGEMLFEVKKSNDISESTMEAARKYAIRQCYEYNTPYTEWWKQPSAYEFTDEDLIKEMNYGRTTNHYIKEAMDQVDISARRSFDRREIARVIEEKDKEIDFLREQLYELSLKLEMCTGEEI